MTVRKGLTKARFCNSATCLSPRKSDPDFLPMGHFPHGDSKYTKYTTLVRPINSPDVESGVEDIDLFQLVELRCSELHLVFNTAKGIKKLP